MIGSDFFSRLTQAALGAALTVAAAAALADGVAVPH